MRSCEYLVTGHITREDNQESIQGLSVQAWGLYFKPWVGDVLREVCLGEDLTNRDGLFSISFHKMDLVKPIEGNLEVYLKVFDRDGRLIYDSRKQTIICDQEKRLAIELSLNPDILKCHLSRPLSWQCPNEPLISHKVIDEIQEALEILVPPSNPEYVARLKAILCAEPPLSIFDGIMRDAWDTLQGDLGAASRYRDILDIICARRAGECCVDKHGAYAKIIDEIFEGAECRKDCCQGKVSECDQPEKEPCCQGKVSECDQPEKEPCCQGKVSECDQPEKEPCCQGKVSECDQPEKEPCCPCRESLISNEKVITLTMAALHISCGHIKTAKTYLGALLDQICRFHFLGSLHRSAAKVLCEGTNARPHFQDLLEFIDTRCRGDNREFMVRNPLPCCETCLHEDLERCIRDAVCAWRRITCYTVTEVKPQRACPGDRIVILGKGFGDIPGQIVFYQKGSCKLGPEVTPEKGCNDEIFWCDEQICAIVPGNAGCGLVLLLPADTVNVCDRFIELHPTGCIQDGFEGTSPEILKFIVKDHNDNECVTPGEPLRIRWMTCAADSVKIEIIDEKNGNVIDTLDSTDMSGKWDFIATNFNVTTHLKVKITAKGQCEPEEATKEMTFVFQKPANLSINGIEITQAIQYYKAPQHLTDPADRGLDNSIRLVSNKTAWVRVYLRSGQDPSFDNGQVPQVDGTLTIERRVNNIWGVVANLTSQNGPIIAEDAFVSHDTERGNIDNSLNFVVPANIVTGLLRFRVNVLSPFVQCGKDSDTSQAIIDVNLTQTLNAAFITIGYNGPDAARTGTLNLPAPTMAQCQTETSWAMTTYPVSGNPNVRVAGTFITNTPLDDPRSGPGQCSPNWTPLLNQIANLVVSDQAANPGNWVYYGIISNGIPVTVPGCSRNAAGGVLPATGGVQGQPITYAHEIGHQFGLPHAPCGNAGTPNPTYTTYEPYDLPVDPAGTTNFTMASIGEYGLDINNGNIANPNTAEDFMSYCTPRWISLFTYNFLLNAAGLVPQVIPTGAGGTADRVIHDQKVNEFVRNPFVIEPFIHMLGVVKEGKVEVTSVSRLDTRYLVSNGRQTKYLAQLLDEEGKIIAQDFLYAFREEGTKSNKEKSSCNECDGNGAEFQFKVLLKDYSPGASLRIIKDGETVWQRDRPSKPIVVSKVRATIQEDNHVNISWRCETAEDIWIRWSDNNGDTWNALTVGLRGNSVTLNVDHLPDGDIKFQILAHDGFSTALESSNTVTLTRRPPVVSILYPQEKSPFHVDKYLHLWGMATDVSGQPISDRMFIWYLDNKEVGNGRDIWIPSPQDGKHNVALKVRNARGDEGTASSTITVKKGD
jgi:hypothetical protein